MIFPPEIFEKILCFTDAVVLTKSKTVCKLWKQIIENILTKNDHWYKKCKEDIPEHLWTCFYEKLCLHNYFDLDGKKDAVVWMNMYKLWMRCRNMVKLEEFVECVQPLPEHRQQESITSMAVSEKFLAVGTSEGYIYFFDKNNLSRPPVFTADEIDVVRDLMFLKTDKETIAMSCSGNNIIHFWDVLLKKRIIKIRAHLVCTSYECYYTCIRNVLTIEAPSYRKVYDCGPGDIVAIGADENEVILYTEYGNYVKLNLGTSEYTYTSKHIAIPNYRIRNYFVFKPDVIAFLTEYGYFGILVKGREWKVHNVLPIVHGTPCTVLICARLLVLGLDSGDVHIYDVEDYETMDFATARSKKLTLQQTPVMSLDLMVHQGEVHLIVAYCRKIYTIKFS